MSGINQGAAASEYLGAIVESSDDAIISKDLNGNITSWNRAAERMFGYTASEIIGRSIKTLAAPEVLDEMPRILDKIRRGERVEHYETIRRRKDGQYIHVSLTISPIRNPEGQIIGASKIARDITEKKQLEAERADLLKREQEGRTAAESAMRLHSAAERNLGLMIEASDRLMGSTTMTEVLNRTLELAQRFFDADAYAVWRSDSTGQDWHVVASVGLSESYSRRGTWPEDRGPVPGLVVIEDVETSELVAQRRAGYNREGIASFIAAPMRIHGFQNGSLTFYFRTRRSFSETEPRMAMALANLAASAISMVELLDEQKQLRADAQITASRSTFLAEASVALGSTLDLKATIETTTWLVVPKFADWCAIDLVGSGGRIQRLAIEHRDRDKLELANELWRRITPTLEGDSGLARVLRSGRSEVCLQIADESRAKVNDEHLQLLRDLGITSAMIVPLVVRGTTIGAITFGAAESGRHYTKADLDVAEQLSFRAALAMDNSNLFTASERDRSALRESNEELEQFAYVSGHDLKEPLRTVASYGQLLAQRYRGKLGADADEFIGYIVDGAVRMSNLIDGLLAYSRLVGREPTVLAPVDSESTLITAIDNLDHVLKESHATVTYDPLPKVLAHGLQLSQVFQNLIGNSIKYRRPEPLRIHVSARQDGAMWTFSVADNGIGIESAYFSRIFGLFKRLHGREIPGTGIGLATCKKIVERHGGRIWVESQPGQGSTFYFTLRAIL